MYVFLTWISSANILFLGTSKLCNEFCFQACVQLFSCLSLQFVCYFLVLHNFRNYMISKILLNLFQVLSEKSPNKPYSYSRTGLGRVFFSRESEAHAGEN